MFPDFYGASTGGFTFKEVRGNVEECLVYALSAYLQMGWSFPNSSPGNKDLEFVAVPPVAAAKLSIYTGMREQNTIRGFLARPFGLSDSSVEKLPTHVCHSLGNQVPRALALLG